MKPVLGNSSACHQGLRTDGLEGSRLGNRRRESARVPHWDLRLITVHEAPFF